MRMKVVTVEVVSGWTKPRGGMEKGSKDRAIAKAERRQGLEAIRRRRVREEVG